MVGTTEGQFQFVYTSSFINPFNLEVIQKHFHYKTLRNKDLLYTQSWLYTPLSETHHVLKAFKGSDSEMFTFFVAYVK